MIWYRTKFSAKQQQQQKLYHSGQIVITWIWALLQSYVSEILGFIECTNVWFTFWNNNQHRLLML